MDADTRLYHAAEEIGARLLEQLADTDSATMLRALRAAGSYLADTFRTDETTIAAAVRAGVAAARCP